MPFIQIISMLGLLVFVARNLLVPGFWALGFGLLVKFFGRFSLNGGWMPVTPETLSRLTPLNLETIWVIGTRLGYSKDFIMATEDTKSGLVIGWSDITAMVPL